MKEKLTLIFVLYALTLTSSNCIKIVDSENATTLNPLNSELKSENLSIEAQVTEKEFDDDVDTKVTLTTPSYVYKIPPTLQNAKKLEKTTEKVISNLKEMINPTPATLHKHQQLIPDGKLKQAIINSKQQSFKSLMEKSNKLKDQVHLEAHPVEVKTEEKETPPSPAPTAKEFVPSPELNIHYSSDHLHPNHFHPMSQYFRPPPQHDVQFSHENHFTMHNPIIDTKWLGSSRSPKPDHLRPPEMFSQFQAQQHGLRNTNVEYHHVQNDHHVTFPHHHMHYQQQQQQQQGRSPQQRPFSYPIHHGVQQLTSERMVFPTDSSSLNHDEIMRQVPILHTKTPAINIQERSKGTWKWIPDSEEELQSLSPYTPFTQFDFQRHQTSPDKPYSFESSDIFSQQTTPPTGPSGISSWKSSGSTETEEVNTGRPSEEAEKGDYKILKSPPPSPWKRIVHVMTAAIPIGLLISALTPRIVYVHPNASAPTIPPNFSQQPPSNVNLPPSNVPNPLRQRGLFNYDTEIAQFLKIMDAQYRDKHRGVRTEGSCEDRYFCEVALRGARHGASRMHRTLYHVALETPKAQAEKSGLSEIFTAIQRQNCNVFRCKKA